MPTEGKWREEGKQIKAFWGVPPPTPPPPPSTPEELCWGEERGPGPCDRESMQARFGPQAEGTGSAAWLIWLRAGGPPQACRINSLLSRHTHTHKKKHTHRKSGLMASTWASVFTCSRGRVSLFGKWNEPLFLPQAQSRLCHMRGFTWEVTGMFVYWHAAWTWSLDVKLVPQSK